MVNVRPWCDISSDPPLMLDPLNCFSFLLLLHGWINKGQDMRYSVNGMVHIKYPLLLNGNNNLCSRGSGFPFSLSEWSLNICSTAYNRK